MPYITSDRVKEVRNEIKKAFPNFKFSITRENHSTIAIYILEGPVDMGTYKQVNEFYISNHYESQPDVRDVLQKCYDVANKGNKIVSANTDYGDWPAFYVSITIGKWDKPFVCTKSLIQA
jgi:hypothetical protein